MTLWSDIFPGRQILERHWFRNPGTFSVTAPPRATHIRASANGAGGWSIDTNRAGPGGAFARTKTICAPGEVFNVQVGGHSDRNNRASDIGVAGDSFVKRASTLEVIVYADRGRNNGAPGQASNCVGDVTRSGQPGGSSSTDGASAGDESDLYQLGFGGRSNAGGVGGPYGPAPGGGGRVLVYWQYGGGYFEMAQAPGTGLVCVEFFEGDPGY